MNFYVGTSGYSYKEWKGTFYPDDLPDKAMLRFYGQLLAGKAAAKNRFAAAE